MIRRNANRKLCYSRAALSTTQRGKQCPDLPDGRLSLRESELPSQGESRPTRTLPRGSGAAFSGVHRQSGDDFARQRARKFET
jgi:hypothetical protein